MCQYLQKPKVAMIGAMIDTSVRGFCYPGQNHVKSFSIWRLIGNGDLGLFRTEYTENRMYQDITSQIERLFRSH